MNHSKILTDFDEMSNRLGAELKWRWAGPQAKQFLLTSLDSAYAEGQRDGYEKGGGGTKKGYSTLVWHKDGITEDGLTKVYENGELKNTEGKRMLTAITTENTESNKTYAEGKKDALNDGGGSGEGINTSEYNRGIKDGRHEHPRAYDIGYKDGGHDALKKVLDILPKEVIEIDDFSSWNAYRLAAREIIKKLIEE